jgi:hypothetical protein
LQVGLQAAGVDLEMARQQHHVAARVFQQRQQQVLLVHLVLSKADANTGGAGGRVAASVVQFPDQGLQVDAHRAVLILLIHG